MSLRKDVKELLGAVNALHERQNKLEITVAASVNPSAGNSALESFAVAAVNSQAQTLGAVGNLIRDIAEAGAERAARALGKRRAATAKRAPNGRMLRNVCRLCDDPNVSDPSVDEITAHSSHKRSRQGPGRPRGSNEIAYADKGDHIAATVPAELVRVDADGHEVVECAACTSGHGDHDHPVQ